MNTSLPLFIPLLASLSPFLLWPIERLLPYPYIAEELMKGFLVYLVLKSVTSRRNQVLYALAIGFLFAFSENILYSPGFIALEAPWTFIQRIALTTILHTITSLIMLCSAFKRPSWLIWGILMSMIIHYLYNTFI